MDRLIRRAGGDGVARAIDAGGRGPLLEHDHTPRRRPPPQRLEGIVHALERQAGRDHLVEAEQTPPIELDLAGHVRAEAVRAHQAAEDQAAVSTATMRPAPAMR